MQVVVELPDKYSVEGSSAEIGAELKLSTALLKYRNGQLSAGAACEFAGVDRYAFLAACQRYGVPTIDYEPEVLSAELEDLKQKFEK